MSGAGWVDALSLVVCLGLWACFPERKGLRLVVAVLFVLSGVTSFFQFFVYLVDGSLSGMVTAVFWVVLGVYFGWRAVPLVASWAGNSCDGDTD